MGRDVLGNLRVRRHIGRATTPLIAVLAVVAAVAAIELYAIQKFGRRSAAPPPPAASAAGTAPTAAKPIGFVDAPASESIRGPAVDVSGWAVAASGIRAVEGRIDGRVFAATLGLPRPDVATPVSYTHLTLPTTILV